MCVCVCEREREREILLGGGVSQKTLLYVDMKQFALILYMKVGEGKLMKGILIVIAFASSSDMDPFLSYNTFCNLLWDFPKLKLLPCLILVASSLYCVLI